MLSKGDVGGDDESVLLSLPFADPEFGGASLKTCTVSVAEDTHSNVEVALKLMQYILAGMLPRLNWYSFFPSGMENILMIVPFSEDVAISVPSLLMAMYDS